MSCKIYSLRYRAHRSGRLRAGLARTTAHPIRIKKAIMRRRCCFADFDEEALRSDDVLQGVEEDVALREHSNRLRRPASHGER
jgi:hypothetical protein